MLERATTTLPHWFPLGRHFGLPETLHPMKDEAGFVLNIRACHPRWLVRSCERSLKQTCKPCQLCVLQHQCQTDKRCVNNDRAEKPTALSRTSKVKTWTGSYQVLLTSIQDVIFHKNIIPATNNCGNFLNTIPITKITNNFSNQKKILDFINIINLDMVISSKNKILP
jgi:hypothetical protein